MSAEAQTFNGKKVSECEICEHRSTNVICSVDPHIWKQLESVKVKNIYKPGQTIFYQGGAPLGLFTVSSGLVKLESTSEEGYTHTLRYVGAGGVLGYRSLFSQDNYHSSAIALESSDICFIPKNVVMDVFKDYPEVAIRIMSLLSKDLGIAESKWTDQMDKEASERIAEAIIFLQDHFQHQNWTRREIAEWAGTTPETVMRTLSHFEKNGYIDQSQGRSIKILDKSALMNQFLK